MKTRKTLSAVIGLMLALCLILPAAAAESAEAGDPAGVWVIDLNGMPRDSLAMELRADGTLSMLMGGELLDGTWSAEEGVLHTAFGDFPFRMAGDRLEADISGNASEMVRSEDSLEVIAGDKDIVAANLVGRWRLNQIHASGGGEITRAQIEASGAVMATEFTADGRMISSVWQDGELVNQETWRYEVVNSGMIMVEGSDPMPITLENSLLGTLRDLGWYYWLRWDEPQADDAPADPELVGLWRIVLLSDPDGSNALGRDMFDMVGFDETLEFTADGRSITITYDHGVPMEEPRTLTYAVTAPGIITLDGQYVERYVIEDDRLTLREPDTTLVFERVTEEASATVEAASTAEASASVEEGTAPSAEEPLSAEEAPASAEAEEMPATEEAAAESEEMPAQEEADAEADDDFDPVAAFTGRWRLDHVEYDDGRAMSRQELTEVGYDEAVTFTTDGGFSSTVWSYGSELRTESYTWELTGGNFVTLDGTIMLPFGFSDGQLVLILSDGHYFYNADTGEAGDPEPAPIDEALLGRWRVIAMNAGDGSYMLDRNMLDSLEYFAEAEFTADHRWIDTFYAADRSVKDRQDSAYAVFTPGIISTHGEALPYTVEGDRLTLTISEKENGLVLVFVRITDEAGAGTEEAGTAETP